MDTKYKMDREFIRIYELYVCDTFKSCGDLSFKIFFINIHLKNK